MNIGLVFTFRNPPQWRRPFEQLYAEQIAQIRLAEALGYDSVWLSEHHFAEDGYSPSLLPIAGAIATVTQRIRIGTDLIVLPLHNAIRVAEDAATVDVISNGRLDLGVGRGYRVKEFDAYGVSRAERSSRLTEGLAVIEGLWAGESFSFEGKHYQIKNAQLSPRPVQRPRPPIWIGSHGPKMLDMMARNGYHFLGTGDPVIQTVYDGAIQKYGRRIEDCHAGHVCWTHVADTADEAWGNVQDHLHYQYACYGKWLAEAGDVPPDQRPGEIPAAAELREVVGNETGTVFIGTPDHVAERIEKMRRLTRTTHLVLGMHMAGLDPARSRRSMELFAQKVMPQLR